MPADNPTRDPESRGQEARPGEPQQMEASSPEQQEREAAFRRGEARERGIADERPKASGRSWVDHAQLGVAARAFTALADNVRDYAVFLMNPAGTIIYWGEGARLIKWWTREQAEGAHLRLMYMAGGSEDGTCEEHLRFAAERGEYTGEGQRVRSDGSTFWAGVTLTALWDEDGTLLGFAKVTRDLTARRAADVLLQAAATASETARADAVAASAAKSGFLATISHEIRTPLNAILGYHELLDIEIDGPLTLGQRSHLERARAAGRHLLGLVTEVLDFSRVDAERVPMKHATFRVGNAVRGALELTAPQTRAARLVISDAVSGFAAGLVAWGDEPRVRQILTNLLANAVKFTLPRGDEPGRITVSAGTASQPPADAQLAGDGPWVYIRVEDTGRGIAPNQLRAVFEPFVQGDMSLTREHGGTGLGLAISRRLARLMSGDLTVRSEVGVGSTFILWLRAAPAETKQAGGVPGHGAGSAPQDRDADPARGEGLMRDPALIALSNALLAELERVLHVFVARLRHDPETQSAHRIAEPVLEDHLASFVADVAATLSSIDMGASEPSESVRDGSLIQRVVAQRHGVQRARLGWSESEVHREFEILGEDLASAVHRPMLFTPAVPTNDPAEGEVQRALENKYQALSIAEGL
ncbi:MAG: sensor protein, partial [Gemmatimonadetes bacterium]|nr:sensor protein [Gemmatimonadota bacterium]